jgi:hypothetical protein
MYIAYFLLISSHIFDQKINWKTLGTLNSRFGITYTNIQRVNLQHNQFPSICPNIMLGDCPPISQQCVPWHINTPECRINEALSTCKQKDILCKFRNKFGVFWIPDLYHMSTTTLPNYADKITLQVYNCGFCRKSCETTLWARVLAIVKTNDISNDVSIIIPVHAMKVTDTVQTLSFYVPKHMKVGKLEIEQRFWHGDAKNVDLRNFEFAGRNLDFSTHRYKINNGSIDDWQLLHDRWSLTKCLGLYGSPYTINIIHNDTNEKQKKENRAANVINSNIDDIYRTLKNNTIKIRRNCGIKDLSAPGYWKTLSSFDKKKNTFLNKFNNSWYNYNCEWNLNKKELDVCLNKIGTFYLLGDSLIRMKEESFLKWGIPREKINSARVKKYGNKQWKINDTDRNIGMNTSQKKIRKNWTDVIIDDFSTVHQVLSRNENNYGNMLKDLKMNMEMIDSKDIGIYYGTHYVNDWRTMYITEPRNQQYTYKTAEVFEKYGGYLFFDTTFVTQPRTEATKDGLHYHGEVDNMLSYMLLSSICNDI